MTYRTELFEFLCELIDIQIKKYVDLALRGIGPDARLNAKLVFNEVNELLDFATQLIAEIKAPVVDNSSFNKLFLQIKFYTEQEYIRAYAGWLLAENNIHATVKERVEQQLEQLQYIAESAHLISTDTSPKTETQKQCQHDSIAIAFHILDLVLQIKKTPDMAKPKDLPSHAFMVLKAQATSRYVTFAQEIEQLHQHYKEFLQESLLAKTSTSLEGPAAQIYKDQHEQQLNTLLANYQTLNPKSKLFAEQHQWYQVGKPQANTLAKSYSTIGLFGGTLLLSGVALLVPLLIKYFASQSDDSILNSTMNLN